MTARQISTLIKAIHGRRTVKGIAKVICGELLGQGTHRDVYVLRQDPSYVVKIEREPGRGAFANAMEYRNWMDNKDWKFLASYLAPCILINETGQVMIQKRVSRDGKRRKDYPKRIPSVITDRKFKNFGWIGDQFVCCDYSFFRICTPKMDRVNWWGTIKNN